MEVERLGNTCRYIQKIRLVSGAGFIHVKHNIYSAPSNDRERNVASFIQPPRENIGYRDIYWASSHLIK